MTPGYCYRATIERVIDGDTIVALVDLGFATFSKQTFRLVGVNCPEMATPEGHAAKAYTESWFASERSCVVQTIRDKREKFGRYLAIVSNRDGRCLNDDLLKNGLAKVYQE